MTDFHFNYQDLIRNGWDGNLDSLEEFKEQLKSMLELGWNPKEMTMQQFAVRMAYKIRGALIGHDDINENERKTEITNSDASIDDEEDPESEEDEDDEDDYEERRRRAEEMGWDEEEMDLEEFEDLFM